MTLIAPPYTDNGAGTGVPNLTRVATSYFWWEEPI